MRWCAVALGLLATGCGGVLDVRLRVAVRDCEGRPELDPFVGATHIEVTAYGEDVDPIALRRRVPLTSWTVEVPDIPPGHDQRIVVTALAEPGDRVIARGETGPLNLEVEDAVIERTVFLRRADTFSSTGSVDARCTELLQPRAGHSASVLSDGRVLLAGGYDVIGGGDRTYLATTEIWDPQTGFFEPGPSMALQRAGHTATRLPGGRTLIVGGFSGALGSALRVAELLDERTMTFTPIEMAYARTGHAAVLDVSSGLVFITGGWDAQGTALASTEIFDPDLGRMDPGPPLPSPRGGLTLLSLSPGRLLAIGGWEGTSAVRRTELFVRDPTGRLVNAPNGVSLQEGRVTPLAGVLGDGRVVVAGGRLDHAPASPNATATDTIDVLDLVNGVATRSTAKLSSARADGWSVSLPDGTVLVGGGAKAGTQSQGAPDADSIYLDGAGGLGVRQVEVGPDVLRWQAPAVLLADGTVFVAGGIEQASGRTQATGRAEVFQPRYQGSRESPYR